MRGPSGPIICSNLSRNPQFLTHDEETWTAALVRGGGGTPPPPPKKKVKDFWAYIYIYIYIYIYCCCCCCLFVVVYQVSYYCSVAELCENITDQFRCLGGGPMGCCSHELFRFCVICTLVPTSLCLVYTHLLDPETKLWVIRWSGCVYVSVCPNLVQTIVLFRTYPLFVTKRSTVLHH